MTRLRNIGSEVIPWAIMTVIAGLSGWQVWRQQEMIRNQRVMISNQGEMLDNQEAMLRSHDITQSDVVPESQASRGVAK